LIAIRQKIGWKGRIWWQPWERVWHWSSKF